MTYLGWIIGFLLPACGTSGASGLPTPALMDMTHIERPSSPNTALAAPAGTQPTPDLVTPTFHVAASRLYATVLAVARDQARTFLAAEYPDSRQAHFVARSAWLNFPDLITAEVDQAGPDASTLVLYSRSVYGHSDLGVNRRRLGDWIAAIQTTLHHSGER